MKEHIQKQINRNRGRNLLFSRLEEIIEIDNDFLESLIYRKERNLPLSKDILDYTVHQTLSAIYQVNQFIEVSKNDKETLRTIYHYTYDRMKSARDIEVLTEHHRLLKQWLSGLYPPHFLQPLSKSRNIGSVINKQYSAELQMDLFNLQGRALMEPVIDIGCGPDSNLASLLRKSCRNLHCLDRELKVIDKHNHRASWFEFIFEKESWGTIISNMSFSNHFLFTLRNRQEYVERYTEKYFEILASLKKNGTFIYAPGIPFAENKIDTSRYRLERTGASGSFKAIEITRIDE